MKKTITPIAVIAALAFAAPAYAAKTVIYKGKTSSGHPVTMKVKNGKIRDFEAGIRTACIPIQGGGIPLGGSELFGFTSTEVRLKPHIHLTLTGKPAFAYNDVTINYDLWLKRRGSRTITGRMRMQYEFLISKYPIGTFTIYSCLGGATFKATRR